MPKVLQRKRITGNQFISSFVTAHFGQHSATTSPVNLQDILRTFAKESCWYTEGKERKIPFLGAAGLV